MAKSTFSCSMRSVVSSLLTQKSSFHALFNTSGIQAVTVILQKFFEEMKSALNKGEKTLEIIL